MNFIYRIDFFILSCILLITLVSGQTTFISRLDMNPPFVPKEGATVVITITAINYQDEKINWLDRTIYCRPSSKLRKPFSLYGGGGTYPPWEADPLVKNTYITKAEVSMSPWLPAGVCSFAAGASVYSPGTSPESSPQWSVEILVNTTLIATKPSILSAQIVTPVVVAGDLAYLNMTVQSNAPANDVGYSIPQMSVGGSSKVTFEPAGTNLWSISLPIYTSPSSPEGVYTLENLQVGNEGMLYSAYYPGSLSFKIIH